jgi:DNA gyrase subunit B
MEADKRMAAKKSYGNESISSLKGADRVRKRPSVIFGSDGLEGCEHAVFEILSNSIDEAREGHGRVITVTRYADRSVEVEDAGRGCPVDWNDKEQRYNWELVYCELYAGGKYDNLSGESYEYSLGLNGLGACATQYASRYMDVTVWRDGFEYQLHFERGELVGEMRKNAPAEEKDRHPPPLAAGSGRLYRHRHPRGVLSRHPQAPGGGKRGHHLPLPNETERGSFETQEFFYENGISDYVAELAGEGSLTAPALFSAERRGRDRADKPEYKVKLSVAFCFSNRVSLIEHYHNSSWLEHGGSPEKATKSAFVGAIDAYLRQNNKYQKNESKLTWNDVEDCLVLVTNNFSTQTLRKPDQKGHHQQVRPGGHDGFPALEPGGLLHRKPLRRGEDRRAGAHQQALPGERGEAAPEHQERSSPAASTSPTGCRSSWTAAPGTPPGGRSTSWRATRPWGPSSSPGTPSTRASCRCGARSSTASRRTTARSSAATSSRTSSRCWAAAWRWRASRTRTSTPSIWDNLRWSKVVICTDGDVDGFQIRTLILTMLYRLCPTLIREGYVYIAETPLFEINCGEKTWFAYSDKEKADIVKSLEGKKVKIDRSKGLGENDPDMMWLTTMNPATRRLIKVSPADAEETARVFDLLLGDNLQGRKDHIASEGYKYLEMADIS